jgi:G3E family GTPase
VVVTGVDPDPMAAAVVGLQFDLPAAVAVSHHIDVERQVLTRTVSDVTGVLEHVETDLAHACVSCAIREDIVPTVERLARSRRWRSVLVRLPVGAEAYNLCSALTWDTRLARLLRVSAVVTAVRAATVVDDVTGEELLAERGHHCALDDRRGVGEVLAAMVEYADAVVCDGVPSTPARGLLRVLARPEGVVFAEGSHELDVAPLVDRLHVHARSDAWSSPVREGDLPRLGAESEGAWRVDLRSSRAFHPERLLDSLEVLGGGAHRSRGCFWVPTRPGRVLEWDGAGGQLSIGDWGPWRGRDRLTRIVLAGVGVAPAHLSDAFEALLVRPGEQDGRWRTVEDGFEPWLGPIEEVA